jgi:two-component system sensor histidine kinase BaeS
MSLMRTLFSRILLAQVVAVVLALIVVTLITRASLNQGFKDFLERQEAGVLQTLAPTLGDFYESRGSWDFLRDNPQNWQRIWRQSRSQQGGPAQDRPPQGRPPQRRPSPGSTGPRRGRTRDGAFPPPEPSTPAQFPHWPGSPGPGKLRDRLFLLAEDHSRIAGAETDGLDGITLEAIQVDGEVVGWIGFIPMGNVLPPDAEHFLDRQIRITLISLAIALSVAAALAFLLARNVSRPVRQLGNTVRDLSRGEYQARARVGTQDEIGDLAAHVNQLADSLEQNRTARQRWMADIAHELRTPVAILKGEIEALADGVRQSDDRMSTSLREEVDQLSVLIDDLQTLALSDAGALNIKKDTLDISGLVRQCVESFRDRLAAREILVELQLEEPLTISADQTRLRQLLHNLLENNCRYVKPAGRVRVALTQHQGLAELVVEDSGPGIAKEQMSRLFDRFYRVEGSRSRSSGGSGLGLSICKNIVEAHGGSIYAEHSEMGGLKIRILLPG